MNDLYKKSLASLLFEESESAAKKNALDVDDPVKLPINKIKSMVEPKIRAFLKKQTSIPSGWDSSLSKEEKISLLYDDGLGAVDSAAKSKTSIEKPTGLPVKLDSFNIGGAVEGPDAKTFYKTVDKVDCSKRPFKVYVEDEIYLSETLIISTGASAKLLGLESERISFYE